MPERPQIRRLRHKLKLSQTDAGCLIGRDRKFIGMIERGYTMAHGSSRALAESYINALVETAQQQGLVIGTADLLAELGGE